MFRRDGEKMNLPWLLPFPASTGEVSMPTLSTRYSQTILFHSPLFPSRAAARRSLAPSRKGCFCAGSTQGAVPTSASHYPSFRFPQTRQIHLLPALLQNTFQQGIIAPVSTPSSGTRSPPRRPHGPPSTILHPSAKPPLPAGDSAGPCLPPHRRAGREGRAKSAARNEGQKRGYAQKLGCVSPPEKIK